VLAANNRLATLPSPGTRPAPVPKNLTSPLEGPKTRTHLAFERGWNPGAFVQFASKIKVLEDCL